MSKIFPFTGGGSLCKKIFLQSEHVSSQIWCQKFFPHGKGGWCPSAKNFFSSLNMYQAKSGVKNFSLYLGGIPLQNFFLQSEYVSSQIWCQKFFPHRGGGESLCKKFFFQSEHVSSQIWCQNFFPLLVGGGGPSAKNFFSSLNMYQAKSGVKNFPLYWGGGGGSHCENFLFQSEHVSSQIWCQKFFPLLWVRSPPWLEPDPSPSAGTGPPWLGLGPRPPSKAGSGPPHPPNVNRLKLLPSPILRMAGGKNVRKFVKFQGNCCC